MKFKLIALGVLLSISSFGLAMESKTIRMPEAQILRERLNKRGFDYFMENTKIVEQLAGQEKCALDISKAVETSYCAFYEYLKEGMPEPIYRVAIDQTETMKPKLYRALLEDAPEALKELEAAGVYKPTKK